MGEDKVTPAGRYIQPLAEIQAGLLAEFNRVPETEVITRHGAPAEVSEEELDIFCCDTGRLVACDPHFLPSAKPLVQKVPPGVYSVMVYRVDLPGLGNRVALAWVCPRTEDFVRPAIGDVVEWRPALYEGDTDRVTKMDVDYGVASYCDSSTAAFYAKWPKSLATMSGWLEAPIPSTYLGRDRKGRLSIEVIGFLCGLGDGSYPSYWGFDKDGNVLGLLTDFLLIKGDAATLDGNVD